MQRAQKHFNKLPVSKQDKLSDNTQGEPDELQSARRDLNGYNLSSKLICNIFQKLPKYVYIYNLGEPIPKNNLECYKKYIFSTMFIITLMGMAKLLVNCY